MKESIELLKTLTDVNGIAGYEYQVKEKMDILKISQVIN